jgi:hypothetical protein
VLRHRASDTISLGVCTLRRAIDDGSRGADQGDCHRGVEEDQQPKQHWLCAAVGVDPGPGGHRYPAGSQSRRKGRGEWTCGDYARCGDQRCRHRRPAGSIRFGPDGIMALTVLRRFATPGMTPPTGATAARRDRVGRFELPPPAGATAARFERLPTESSGLGAGAASSCGCIRRIVRSAKTDCGSARGRRRAEDAASDDRQP